MKLEDVKVGQTVRISGEASLFYRFNVNKLGKVREIDGDYITVDLEDGDDDYGYASGLELVLDPAAVPSSVREAIANVEDALAKLKALVG